MILTFKEKLSEEERAAVEEANDRIKGILYTRSITDGAGLSRALDAVEWLYEYLCAALIRRGILLRAEADLDTLVAGRSA